MRYAIRLLKDSPVFSIKYSFKRAVSTHTAPIPKRYTKCPDMLLIHKSEINPKAISNMYTVCLRERIIFSFAFILISIKNADTVKVI